MAHVKKSAALDEQARSEGGRRAFLQKLMDKGGVRAQLRSGNILTGSFMSPLTTSGVFPK